ncbi:MAG: hypothetical protein EA340_02130 [Nitriliruptor sp.]|nr:MAG: hypothetical protein EA340_02130 [Nitriliruptor sp.]
MPLSSRAPTAPVAGRSPGTRVRSVRSHRLGAVLTLAVAAAVALVGCAGAPDPIEVVVEPASFDLAIGEDQRLLVGLFTPERQLVAHGEVELGLAYLGDGSQDSAAIEQSVPARFVPIPGGQIGAPTDAPSLVEDTGTGVYAATVDLDRPGVWGVRIAGELEDGTPFSGNRTFPVLEEHLVPAPGDEAPRVDNLTLDDVESGAVRAVQLDSRAQAANSEVAFPHLHVHTVAGSIEANRPVVVAVATPVYCRTRFCGPLTEVIAELALRYEDRADFIHLEVWEEFDSQTLNESAAAFIQTEIGGNEPWVFLIDEDGRIAARWDNILDVEALTEALEDLPVLPEVGT